MNLLIFLLFITTSSYPYVICMERFLTRCFHLSIHMLFCSLRITRSRTITYHLFNNKDSRRGCDVQCGERLHQQKACSSIKLPIKLKFNTVQYNNFIMMEAIVDKHKLIKTKIFQLIIQGCWWHAMLDFLLKCSKSLFPILCYKVKNTTLQATTHAFFNHLIMQKSNGQKQMDV